jgi:hypothetical protein
MDCPSPVGRRGRILHPQNTRGALTYLPFLWGTPSRMGSAVDGAGWSSLILPVAASTWRPPPREPSSSRESLFERSTLSSAAKYSRIDESSPWSFSASWGSSESRARPARRSTRCMSTPLVSPCFLRAKSGFARHLRVIINLEPRCPTADRPPDGSHGARTRAVSRTARGRSSLPALCSRRRCRACGRRGRSRPQCGRGPRDRATRRRSRGPRRTLRCSGSSR